MQKTPEEIERARIERLCKTARERELFGKYLLGSDGSSIPGRTEPATSPIGSRQLESSSRLLVAQRALSEKELQLVELRAQHIRQTMELQSASHKG